MTTQGWEQEVAAGERFAFGRNWRAFLSRLDEARISEAGRSLCAMLHLHGLEGRRFLDIGCGSGLFSLAARRLGAEVCSFDYDPSSVACAQELKARHFPGDGRWSIAQGSALDEAFLHSLGRFDIVYSWGVLHHTGQMWRALELAALPVREGGLLYLAIYNRQPLWTPFWRLVKRTYNRLPGWGRRLMAAGFFLYFAALLFVADVVRGRNPFARHRGENCRGMSMWHDVVDWIGGWPFEVASPEEIFRFYRERGFALREMKTCGGKQGCNEFVFERAGGKAGAGCAA